MSDIRQLKIVQSRCLYSMRDNERQWHAVCSDDIDLGKVDCLHMPSHNEAIQAQRKRGWLGNKPMLAAETHSAVFVRIEAGWTEMDT